MSIALGHMQHAYMQTDGTYKFPNSREGDILKQAKAELDAVRGALELAMEWMDNWGVEWADDPEWVMDSLPRIKAAIKGEK